MTFRIHTIMGVALLLCVLHPRAFAQSDAKEEEPKKFDRAALEQRANELRIPVRMGNATSTAVLMGFTKTGKPLYYTTDNSVSAASTATDKLYPGGTAGLSLTGSGVIIGEWDGGGVLTTHQEFGGRATQMDSPASVNFHATHVAGTLIASGVQAAARGMSYQASLQAYDWDNDSTEMKNAAAAGLKVSNHSYGFLTGWYLSGGTWYWFGDVNLSTVEDAGFGYYSEQTWSWDNIARSYPNYLIVKSAGNDRLQGPAAGTGHYYWNAGTSSWTFSTATRNLDGGPLGYDCVTDIGNAKNILTVGAVEDIAAGYSNPASVVMSSFSGWGPTDDGRIKPDIVANGVGLYSSYVPNNNSYASLSGTSMASPSAAGSIGLLLQHQNNLFPGIALKSSTMKGLLIHTADEAGSTTGPDYSFGWGLLNTTRAAQVMSANAAVGSPGHITEHNLTNGSSYTRNIMSNGSPLRVTVAWTDPAPQVLPTALNNRTPRLVNDLDVRIIGPGPTTYFPYRLDPDNPANAATLGDNIRDNVEMIHIAAPVNGGIYTVQVTHKGALTSGAQLASIIVTGNVAIPNQPPVANAGTNQTINCAPLTGASVFLNGSGSSDPDNDPLTYTWREGATVLSGPSTIANAVVLLLPGTHVITLTVDDGKGGTNSANVTVTVNADVTPPTITAPLNLTAGNEPGVCGRSRTATNFGIPTTADNCGAGGLTVTNNAPAVFPIGTTTVVWTVRDAANNVATASHTVTILDTQAPTVTAPANIVTGNDPGICGKSLTNVVLGSPVLSDNCGTGALVVTNNAPANFPIGTTTVVWTVRDAANNTTTASQTVTINDTQAPTVTAPSTIVASNDPGLCGKNRVNINLGTPTVGDNCGTGALVITNNAPSVFPIGNTTVTWTVRDAANNTTTASQTVTINDTQAPTIVAPSNITLANEAGLCGRSKSLVNLGTPSTSDNCAVTVLSNNAPNVFPLGTTIVTWTAMDAKGNFSTATHSVTINDTEPPSIQAPPTVTVNAAAGMCGRSGLNLGSPTASDACGPVTLSNNAPAMFPVGTTNVTWTARDNYGNTKTAVQQVIVKDLTPPSFGVVLYPAYLTPVNRSMRTITASVTLSDNCPGSSFVLTSVTSNEPDAGTGPGDLPGDIFAATGSNATQFAVRAERSPTGFGRTYTVVYTARDYSNNLATVTRQVYVPWTFPKDEGLVFSDEQAIPASPSLEQNYPNPFSGSTSLVFRLPEESTITLAVYNALGEEVARLAEGNYNAGSHAVMFNGHHLPEGVYFARLTQGTTVIQTKMVLVR